MSEAVEYYNSVPAEYDGARCHYYDSGRRECCGLPAWLRATEPEPRCVFHTRAPKPRNIGFQLEEAVRSEADLQGAILAGENLCEAKLHGAKLCQADLFGAQLVLADLSRADLAYADLRRANLNGADLSGAPLSWAKLTRANLSGAILSGAQMVGTRLRCADLRYALCSTLFWDGLRRDTAFYHADLRGACLAGIRLAAETDLTGVRLGGRPLGRPEDRIRDEIPTVGGKQKGALGECADVYRQLKQCSQHSGDYARAGAFYFRERACQWRYRRQAKLGGWGWGLLYEYLCGFGERPWRIAGWMLFFVILGAICFACLGVTGMDVCFSLDVSAAGAVRLVRLLCLSVATFTTLGFGGCAPATWAGEVIAAAEAGSGVVLMPLFLVCIVRQFSR